MMKRLIGISMLIAAVVAAAAVRGRAADADPHLPIKIVLYPAHEPRPALKYQLLPPLLERRPGNAAIHYLKVPHERTALFASSAFWTTVCNWAEMPLPELRKAAGGEGKQYAWIVNPSGIFDDLDRGARCESCDWDLPIREKEFYAILLPEVQSARQSGRILAARARLQIADGRYDEAVRTLRTGFAFGRHVAQAPTVISGLVGATITGSMSKQIETFIQQPDAPNLYWALASLPRPVIDFRPGFDAEMAAIYLQFPDLRDLDKKSYTAEQWRQLLQQIDDKMVDLMLSGILDAPLPRRPHHVGLAASMLAGYPRAKRFLIARGHSPAEVEAMPVPQVILLYTMQNYDELRDDMFKWLAVPYAEARRGLEQVNRRIRDESCLEIIPLAGIFLPALQSCKQCEARTDRDLVALEVLEALRLYAADHDGRLPENLKDITEVPIPLDPLRGEPFLYQRQGDTAILESPSPANPNLRLRYEIQLNREGAKP